MEAAVCALTAQRDELQASLTEAQAMSVSSTTRLESVEAALTIQREKKAALKAALAQRDAHEAEHSANGRHRARFHQGHAGAAS